MDTNYKEMANSVETWKPVNGFEGYYEVSSTGSIRSVERDVRRGKAICHLKSCPMSPALVNGYLRVCLNKGDHRKNLFIHRIVATAFIDNPEALPIINHKNGIRTDNRVENLEWCTVFHNIRHALDTGLKSKHNLEYRKKVAVINISTKEEVVCHSLHDAANFIGEKTPGSISSFFRGGRKHVKGFIFRYVDHIHLDGQILLYDNIISACVDAKNKVLNELSRLKKEQ